MIELDDRRMADLMVAILNGALRTLVAKGAITVDQGREALAAAALDGVRPLAAASPEDAPSPAVARAVACHLLDAGSAAEARAALSTLLPLPSLPSAPGPAPAPSPPAQPAVDPLLRRAMELSRSRDWPAARNAARAVLALAPATAPAWHLAGVAAVNLGDRAGATRLLTWARRLDADLPLLTEQLGTLLAGQEHPEEALALLETVPLANTDSGRARAKALAKLGRTDEAEGILRRLVALDPSSIKPLGELHALYDPMERLDRLAPVQRWAHRIDPLNARLLIALIFTLLRLREWETVSALLDRFAALPHDQIATHRRNHSALIIALLCEPDVPDAVRMKFYRIWNRLYLPPGRGPVVPAGPRSVQGRPLRVGFYAGSIQGKPLVDYFLPAMVREARAGGCTPIVYANCPPHTLASSPLPQRLPGVDLVPVGQWSDHEMVERVRRDALDVYVDLKGHFAGDRLSVLASHPAPVTAILHGNEDTCGLETVDALIGDRFIAPPPHARSERRLLALEGSTLCYTPPDYTPVPASTGRAEGFVFGAFHQYRKIKPEAIALWSAAMRAVDGSRIAIKCHDPTAPVNAYDRLRDAFAACGIAADRLTFFGRTDTHAGHFALYDSIDVMVDAFPYNGVTTTCEALWMGVPVLTLHGSRMVAAHGASFVHHAGLGWLAARDEAEFVAIARRLAEDRAWRDKFRHHGRDALRQTTVFNEVRYARSLGEGLRAFVESAVVDNAAKSILPQEGLA